MNKTFTLFATLVALFALAAYTTDTPEGNYKAHKASAAIAIDGKGSEADWNKADWKEIKHVWVGAKPDTKDFQGKYKMLWDKNYVYYLVEIKDDSLSDQRKSPLDQWWDDDCLELFVDENRSKGLHQFDHNAFAYHITLDYDVVDMGTQKQPLILNDHLKAKWLKTDSVTYVWEVAVKVFDDTYDEKSDKNKPVKLSEGKKLGFAVSYNDSDGKMIRENMMGSIHIEGEDKNRGWIDAGIFGELELVK